MNRPNPEVYGGGCIECGAPLEGTSARCDDCFKEYLVEYGKAWDARSNDREKIEQSLGVGEGEL